MSYLWTNIILYIYECIKQVQNCKRVEVCQKSLINSKGYIQDFVWGEGGRKEANFVDMHFVTFFYESDRISGEVEPGIHPLLLLDMALLTALGTSHIVLLILGSS